MKTKVFVIKSKDKGAVVKKVIEITKDILKKEKCKDKKVLVKPNCVGGYNPSRGVTTNPDLIFNICSGLENEGCNVIMGDCHGGSPGTVESVFTKSGFLPLCERWFQNIGSQATKTDFQCRSGGTVHLCNAVLDADIVISAAKFKASCYMILSAAVKNLYGTIPGTQKAKIHEEFPARDDFANMLIALSQKPRRSIAVIDGSIVMEGNGPVHGNLREENIYIVSESIYAADLIAGRMMGLSPNQIPTVKCSIEQKLLSPDDVEVITDMEDIRFKNFMIPVTLPSYMNGVVDSVDTTVKEIASVKVVIDEIKCIGCKQCAEHCPVHAITMAPKPVVDEKLCIHCFCCNELCPVGAARVENDIQNIWDKTMKSEVEKA